MAAGAGISAQLMYKSETSWGTAVTPDKTLELLSEKVKNDGGKRFESKGIRSSRLTKTRAARGVVHIGGPIVVELPNITVATLLKHMFGTVVTTGSGPYTHTLTPGILTGKSMTMQVGRPSTDGTVQPFTWAGVKIPDWELAAALNEYAKLTLTVSAKSETTATALASASYAGGYAPFTFTQASLSIASGAVAVNAFTLKASNALKTDREGVGSAAIREQVQTGLRDYTGTVDAEFEGLTQYNHFLAADQVALVTTFTNGTDSLTITMNAELIGESPEIAGPELLSQPLPFAVLGSSDSAAITAVLVNSDSSAV